MFDFLNLFVFSKLPFLKVRFLIFTIYIIILRSWNCNIQKWGKRLTSTDFWKFKCVSSFASFELVCIFECWRLDSFISLASSFLCQNFYVLLAFFLHFSTKDILIPTPFPLIKFWDFFQPLAYSKSPVCYRYPRVEGMAWK